MKKIFQKIKNSRKQIIAISLFSFLSILIFQVDLVFAGDNPVAGYVADKALDGLSGGIVTIYGEFIGLLVFLTGQLISLVIDGLTKIASYNNFILEETVVGAWTQVRNFSNMFFVLAMLIIAFATMFKYENYAIKRALPKLIIMAFLVNFSRTICGLAIDFSQLFMATFLSSVGSSGASYVTALGIQDYLTMVTDNGGKNLTSGKVKLWESVAGLTTGFIFTLIAGVVLVVILITLIMRVVFLWIYVILSPLAFMLYAFPGGQKYFNQWMGEFTKYVIIGPLLAFFVWLALVVGNNPSMTEMISTSQPGAGSVAEQMNFGTSKMMNTSNFIHFIIAIGMLVGGLKISSEMGGAAGSTAGKGLAAISKGQKVAVNFGKNRLRDAGKATGRAGLMIGGAGLRGVGTVLHSDTLKKTGQLAGAWRGDLIKNKDKAKKTKRLAMLKSMGMGDNSLEALNAAAQTRGGKIAKAAGGTLVAAGLSAGTVGFAAPALAALVGFTSAVHAMDVAGKGMSDWDEKSRKKNKEKNETNRQDNLNKTRVDRDENLRRSVKGNDLLEERDDHLDASRQLRAQKLSALNSEYSNVKHRKNDPTYLSAVKSLNTEHQKRIEVVENNHESEVEKAARSSKGVGNAQDDYRIDREKVNFEHDEVSQNLDKETMAEKFYGDWHPNKVIINATSAAIKETKLAKDRVSSVSAGGSINDFEPSSFYSSSGQTTGQKKFFTELTSGSKKSSLALTQMESTLKAINADSLKASYKTIQSLKMGIAAFKVNDGDVSKLSKIINQLNTIDTGDKSEAIHTTTVEGMEKIVIKKS